MVNDLLTSLDGIVARMDTTQWIIVGAVALVVAILLLRQLAKAAVVVVLLVVIGMIVMHGRAVNWSF